MKIPTVTYDTDGRKKIALYSYVVTMTEKNGSRVQALRFDGWPTKLEVTKHVMDAFQDWKVKCVHKLYEEDFEE